MATMIPPWAVAAPPSAYDPDCLSLESETIINHKSSITNVITRTHDALGRNSGFNLTHPQTPTPPYSVSYGYDTYGRFNAVTSSAFSVVNYSHLPHSDLIESTTLNLQPATFNLTTTRTYEDHRNLITAVEHEVDATLISRYTYANNEIGHRTHVVNQGSAFADVGDAMNFYGGRECASMRKLLVGYQEFIGINSQWECKHDA